MLHLALVNNVMTAIGAAPSLARPNFPRHSEFLPPGVEFALLPFGADSLTHFLYLERPEGMERVDAAEFVPAAPLPQPVGQAEVMPRVQGFLTVGHLYRGIEQGLSDLAARLGEQVLFVGEPRAQATPDRFRYPQLIAVTDLASARAALDEIIDQGEGARGDWRSAHYGRFYDIWKEYQQLREQDPFFEPARPVLPAFTQQPYDIQQPQPQVRRLRRPRRCSRRGRLSRYGRRRDRGRGGRARGAGPAARLRQPSRSRAAAPIIQLCAGCGLHHNTSLGVQNGGYRGAHHRRAVTVGNKAPTPVGQIKSRRFNPGNLRLTFAAQQPLRRHHRQLPV
jgi:hypothetical protein